MPAPSSLAASCHCGRVRIAVAAPPLYINECNCSFCTALGTWWGYFGLDEVSVEGATTGYTRADVAEPTVAAHFCPVCGATTHWLPTPAFARRMPQYADRMGVNMRLFDKGAIAGIELRFPDGRAGAGSAGAAPVRPSMRIGRD